MAERLRVSVTGIVQGVGFRPFVYRLATSLRLRGWVSNTTDGVVIEVEGKHDSVRVFLEKLRNEAPPMARIEDINFSRFPQAGYVGFSIRHSLSGADPNVLVSPDIAICPDCRRELLDPSDRRFRYPFINCTNCGPRYTIVRKAPYDRLNTSMSSFKMCPRCDEEYSDPSDRRFHAQPNACPECGPSLTLVRKNGTTLREDPLPESIELLKKGGILAVKGLGGFHLAADALSSHAVERLRKRKGREEKPFALMVRDLDAAAGLCLVGKQAEDLLTSTESPIVLLPRLEEPGIPVAPEIARGSRYFGLMLPYTPLHILLMEDFQVLVMTSGNLSEEPLCAAYPEALERLRGVADAFLTHDREIVLRCDDSIVRPDPSHPEKGPVVLRRARGFVPSPVLLPLSGEPVLALGPELKGTVCLTRKNRAFIGQHLGDLKNLETLEFLSEVVYHLTDILEVTPSVIVRDLHPDYLTTTLAENGEGAPWPRETPVLAVQHHHAHVLSSQGEAGLTGPCIGVALDGTGYGPDGTIWGGEILEVNGTGMRRIGHLRPLWMPGGEKAIEHPWKMAVSYMVEAVGEDAAFSAASRFFPGVAGEEISVIAGLCARKSHGILTSSAGRLFDAVSAVLGVCLESSYEGQAAIELETLTDREATDILPYSLAFGSDGCLELDLVPAFAAILEMAGGKTALPRIGGMFHATMAHAFAEAVSKLFEEHPDQDRSVPLGGGVFQNEIFCALFAAEMGKRDLTPVFHHRVPTNDGGISLGQALYALHAMREGVIEACASQYRVK